MASSGNFQTADDARQYLAGLVAQGVYSPKKPISQLKPNYAKRIANNLRRQEQSGATVNIRAARGHAAGEGHKGTTFIPPSGKVAERHQIGTFPKRLAPERDTVSGKINRQGVYRGAKVPQVPDIIKLINKWTKTNIIAVGIYGMILFDSDPMNPPHIGWLTVVVDKQEFLADLKKLDTGQVRHATDPELLGLAHKYLTRNRPDNLGVYSHIFGWSARDARQPGMNKA